MKGIAMMVGAMCTGFFALTFPARAGSDAGFSSLQTIELYGSPCRSQVERVGGASVAFVCEFDHTLAAGILRVPEMSEGDVARLTLLEKNLERGTPLERHALRVRVAKVRLEDGSECARVASEKMIFVGSKRVAFICASGNFGLIGPFERLEGMLLAERVALPEDAGLESYGTTILPITAITLDAETPLP